MKTYSINCENILFVSVSDGVSCGNMGAKLSTLKEYVIVFHNKLMPHSNFP